MPTPQAPVKEQLRVLQSGVAEVHPRDGLVDAAAEGRPRRVKLGIDPSPTHLTLGRAVVLRKLAQFQRLGSPPTWTRAEVAPLAGAGLVASRGEARRLVTQGAVRLDGQPVDSIEQSRGPGDCTGAC